MLSRKNAFAGFSSRSDHQPAQSRATTKVAVNLEVLESRELAERGPSQVRAAPASQRRSSPEQSQCRSHTAALKNRVPRHAPGSRSAQCRSVRSVSSGRLIVTGTANHVAQAHFVAAECAVADRHFAHGCEQSPGARSLYAQDCSRHDTHPAAGLHTARAARFPRITADQPLGQWRTLIISTFDTWSGSAGTHRHYPAGAAVGADPLLKHGNETPVPQSVGFIRIVVRRALRFVLIGLGGVVRRATWDRVDAVDPAAQVDQPAAVSAERK